MKNKASYIDLLKETIEITRDSRPYERGALRPYMINLVKKELIALTPDGFKKFAENQIDFVFLSIVFIEQSICTDLINHFSKFWTDNLEDRILMKVQIEQSIDSGSLGKFIEKDGRDRLILKPEVTTELISILIPISMTTTTRISEKISNLISKCLVTGNEIT